jgi:hypothetical protein
MQHKLGFISECPFYDQKLKLSNRKRRLRGKDTISVHSEAIVDVRRVAFVVTICEIKALFCRFVLAFGTFSPFPLNQVVDT